MKKKILCIHFNMELGGAETSLLGLLDTIDYSNYDVDLFLYSHSGELLPLINPNVNLLPEVKEYRLLTKSIGNSFKLGKFMLGCARSWARGRSLLSKGPLRYGHNYKQYFHKMSMPFVPDIPGEYDLAISFNDPHYILGMKSNAKVKMAWFHTDASKIIFWDKIEKDMWERADYVVNVSEECKRAFDEKHKYLNNQSIVIENILSKEYILKRSLAMKVSGEMPHDGCIRILSIGRFTTAKNFDNIPEICRLIRDAGVMVKWYLIGYGSDEQLIREKIAEHGMEQYVIILGKKDNPYPYILEADLYVQPSRFEGKSVSVREAQILCKPVVITNYATAVNQLENGKDGIIVPMDNEKCAMGIVKLIQNPEKMEQLQSVCKKRDYTNSEEIKKIYMLIEGK